MTEPSNAGPSDHSLLRRFRRGDEDAATQLYVRYARRLHSLAAMQCAPDLAQRVDADDIVQSVFHSFFQGVTKGYYDVPAGEDLWKLFLVITLHKIRAYALHHHAAKRDVRVTRSGDRFERALRETPTSGPSIDFLEIVIDEALDRLPRVHKRIVELRIEGYGVAEIAEQSGRSNRTVERVLQDFRHRLSGILE